MLNCRLRRILRCANVLALAGFSAATTAQPAPVPVTATRVAGSVHRIDGAIDVIGASIGPDGILLVDGGYPPMVGRVRALLRTLSGTDAPPRLVVNTHWHHAFANESLGPTSLIMAHRAVRPRLGRSNLMAGRQIPPWTQAGWPAVSVGDSLTLHFNGERISIVHLPRAHTDGDVVVIFHGSNVVMTGDAYVPHLPWIDIAAGGSLDGLRQAIAHLLRIVPRDATVVPGHGPTGTYADIERFQQMLNENVAHVERQIAAGRSLAEIQAAGVPEQWRSWKMPCPSGCFSRASTAVSYPMAEGRQRSSSATANG